MKVRSYTVRLVAYYQIEAVSEECAVEEGLYLLGPRVDCTPAATLLKVGGDVVHTCAEYEKEEK